MNRLVGNLMNSTTVRVFRHQFDHALTLGLRLSNWAVPGALLAGWMIYPALTPAFKESLGLPDDKIVVSSVRYTESDDEDKMPEVASG